MAENKNILDRISPFSLLLTLVILMVIGAALIPLVDVGASPKPRQGKTLTISYSWRNASPKVVEQEVTSKIEGLVSAVKGVGEVSSVSNFGSGRVTVVLKKEADVSAVKFEISSLLKQVRKKLPEDVSYPVLSGGEVVNEDGGMLSQGQKQLLCITRIMLCLPPMLILDEATSSIDTRTEMRIQNAFARLMEGRTSFIVAHRLSTIKEADIILVMKDGNIIEQGNHETLLKKGGAYATLYNSQFA